MLTLILLLLTYGAVQEPQPECTLGEVKPLLRSVHSGDVKRIRNGPRDLTESTRLANGTPVQVSQGGCAHYGVKITFTLGQKAVDDKLINEAFQLVSRLNKRTESYAIHDIVAILKKYRKDDYKSGDMLQDSAYPDVTLYVEREPSSLVVTYSFVL
jgi:hypothetical protein